MSATAPLTLHHGRGRCEIHPTLGGSIGRWAVGDQEMFRAASAAAIEARDPLGMATFPLVPYSNRVGYARFDWGAKAVSIRPNFAPEPHAIHGVGWRRPWTVSRQSDAAVRLSLAHAPDSDWPWAFEAEQFIALTDDTLTLTLRATNRADSPVPLAFGHHPYFDQLGATLSFSAQTVWLAGDDSLPTEPVTPFGQFDFTSGSPVAGRDIDHCYDGVTGPAVIGWVDRPLTLEIASSPQLPTAVVFVPDAGASFCFEPVLHVNNALNLHGRGTSMPIVAPGQTTETVVTFRALPK